MKKLLTLLATTAFNRNVVSRTSAFSHSLAGITLLLIGMLIPQKGWAALSYQTETYDFGTCATSSGSIDFDALTMTYGGTTYDISRFSFKTCELALENTTVRYGLWVRSGGALTINNLRAGDIVTITFSESTLSYSSSSSAHCYLGTTLGSLTDGSVISTTGTAINITSDGDLVLKPTYTRCYIQTITINAIEDATYSIETVTTGTYPETTFELTGDGRMPEKAIAIPFMTIEFGSDLNGPIVENSQMSIPDWSGYTHIWPIDDNTTKNQGTFYVFKPTASGKLRIDGVLNQGSVCFVEMDESTNTYSIKNTYTPTDYSSNLTIGWLDVTKGKTYYLCEDFNGTRTHSTYYLKNVMFQNVFSVESLGVVLENGATEGTLTTVKNGGTLNSASVRATYDGTGKKVSDNIDTSNMQVTISDAGVLSVSGISYKDTSANQGGVIILDLDFENGDAIFVITIPYSAEKGHTWDFYSNVLEIGQYSNTSSQLYEETVDGDWKKTYMNTIKDEEPIFKNVYDMDYDNADMIWETEGLILNAPTLKSGLYNENAVSTSFADRFVGMMVGSELIIPGLKDGDRIKIKMGRYGGPSTSEANAYLNITGAKDALGTEINSTVDYKVGGCDELNGEYNFIKNGDGEFKMEMTRGQLIKLYTIQIYQGDFICNNSILGSYYQGVNTDQSTTGFTSNFHLHYYGKGERIKLPTILDKTGTLTTASDDFTLTTSDTHVTYTPTVGEFGAYNLRLVCYEQSGTYATDYADRTMAVGYRETMSYPYTWDFTDLQSYISDAMTVESNYADNLKQWNGYSHNISYSATSSNRSYNVLFAGGSELYAGNKLFAESAGLGISFDNNDATYNGTMEIVDGGLKLHSEGSLTFGDDVPIARATWWRHRITIPYVPADAAVYVRVAKTGINDNNYFYAGYTYGDYNKNSNTPTTFTVNAVEASDGSGDVIYAVAGNETSASSNITLYFNGVILKKIAVSTDAKTVNKLGYASESRDKEIDPELMGYMTGTGLKAYTVTSVTYGDEAGSIPSITLTEVPSTNVISSATTGDHNAYIIYNTDDATDGSKAVSLINSGFHLFVPDMHDAKSAGDDAVKSALDVKNNSLVSMVEGGSVAQTSTSGYYTNYLMSSTYISSSSGQSGSGEEAFYRAGTSASLGANKAYLQLVTANVQPSSSSSAGAKFAIIFIDEETDGIATSLDGVVSREIISVDNNYYTLSGIKTKNPVKGGIYIKNGKKIIVK